MHINNKPYQTIWLKEDDKSIVQIIDQRSLPFELVIEDLATVENVFFAIKDMHVRGAPLIGATAAFGMYLAALSLSASDEFMKEIIAFGDYLRSSRPTAVNLEACVNRQINCIQKGVSNNERIEIALQTALKITQEEKDFCFQIGQFGLPLIEEISKKKKARLSDGQGETVNILTHCNAGWLACIDHGIATAPIYFAHDKGIKLHVWVDETRPRNQGARLTAFELGEHGVPHTIIADNTGGHLMQNGMVDLVIVGSDRTTINGNVANKIGTYLKALAANDNNIPFYVALPSSSFDWEMSEKEVPIEVRDETEVSHMEGIDENGDIKKIRITPEKSQAINYGFDVTPARLVSGLITEKGICKADKKSILNLFPDKD